MSRTAPFLPLVLALSACATQPAATPPTASTATPAAGCVPSASRLPNSICAAGTSHSQQDLNSTGLQSTPGQALRMIDPAVH